MFKALKYCSGDGWFPDAINCFGAHTFDMFVTDMYCYKARCLSNSVWVLYGFSLLIFCVVFTVIIPSTHLTLVPLVRSIFPR